MTVAVDHNHVDILEHCVLEGGHISDDVMLYVLGSRAFKIYNFLLTTKAQSPSIQIMSSRGTTTSSGM